jgi:hypothetical protein
LETVQSQDQHPMVFMRPHVGRVKGVGGGQLIFPADLLRRRRVQGLGPSCNTGLIDTMQSVGTISPASRIGRWYKTGDKDSP